MIKVWLALGTKTTWLGLGNDRRYGKCLAETEKIVRIREKKKETDFYFNQHQKK